MSTQKTGRARRSCINLLDAPPFVFDPTPRPSPSRIVMRPMQHASAIVPFELASEADRVSPLKRNTICEIDIMCDEECPAVAKLDQEALMLTTLRVIRQGLLDLRRDLDNKARGLGLEGGCNSRDIVVSKPSNRASLNPATCSLIVPPRGFAAKVNPAPLKKRAHAQSEEPDSCANETPPNAGRNANCAHSDPTA